MNNKNEQDDRVNLKNMHYYFTYHTLFFVLKCKHQVDKVYSKAISFSPVYDNQIKDNVNNA